MKSEKIQKRFQTNSAKNQRAAQASFVSILDDIRDRHCARRTQTHISAIKHILRQLIPRIGATCEVTRMKLG